MLSTRASSVAPTTFHQADSNVYCMHAGRQAYRHASYMRTPTHPQRTCTHTCTCILTCSQIVLEFYVCQVRLLSCRWSPDLQTSLHTCHDLSHSEQRRHRAAIPNPTTLQRTTLQRIHNVPATLHAAHFLHTTNKLHTTFHTAHILWSLVWRQLSVSSRNVYGYPVLLDARYTTGALCRWYRANNQHTVVHTANELHTALSVYAAAIHCALKLSSTDWLHTAQLHQWPGRLF